MVRHTRINLTIIVLAAYAFTASARADNYFLPHGSNLWNAPANWSLGHCPLSNEVVSVNVTTNSNKTVQYNWSGVSDFSSVRVDGSTAGYYAMIFQTDHFLGVSNDLRLASSGPAWYWIEGPAFLWVNDIFYAGYNGANTGHFYLATIEDESAGLYVGDLCYVGYSAPGDFDHHSGYADIGRLYVGQSDPGTYWLGPSSTAHLTVQGQIVIGNGNAGTIEQSGGSFEQVGANGIIMGLNTGGVGSFLMTGGTLDVDHISLAWNGDAYFTQSGGTVTTAGDVNVGCQGTHPSRTWYKLNEDDGTAVLDIGGDLLVGVQTLGKYEQDGGTATIAGNIEIWDGDSDPGSSSYLYMGLNAGLLEATSLLNHTGYFDQDGGVLDVTTGVNDSSQGMNLDNNADCRIHFLTNNAGTVALWRNAILRGPLAFGSIYWLCEFENNATFQMGSAAADGGSFRGTLTNNGTFLYTQGDFSTSTLINYGAVTLNNDFTAHRIVNHATSFTAPTSLTITATGAGLVNAFENNGAVTMQAGSHIDVAASKLVNNDRMYAGGPGATPATIHGNVEQNDYLLPSDSSLGAGSQLVVTGSFTESSAAKLRIRLRGNTTGLYDRLTVQGAANLGGTLEVRLTDGFVPSLGDRFYPVSWGSRVGTFSGFSLPTPPAGLAWEASYGTTQLRLAVVAAPPCPADLDGNGVVDAQDLALLLSAFAHGPGGDVDGDLDTDAQDLSLLLSAYAQHCP